MRSINWVCMFESNAAAFAGFCTEVEVVSQSEKIRPENNLELFVLSAARWSNNRSTQSLHGCHVCRRLGALSEIGLGHLLSCCTDLYTSRPMKCKSLISLVRISVTMPIPLWVWNALSTVLKIWEVYSVCWRRESRLRCTRHQEATRSLFSRRSSDWICWMSTLRFG